MCESVRVESVCAQREKENECVCAQREKDNECVCVYMCAKRETE